MNTEQPAPPKMKYKSFTYRTAIQWLGGRAGTQQSEGKPSFRVASPPEFRGEAGVWTPEDLFVASVNACVMATFVAFAERQKLPVTAYSCDAEGLIEFVDSGYRFTRLTLRPQVIVRTAEAVAQAEKTVRDAHANCFVSNSIRSEVILEPRISVEA
jgi:organic hydroperoxide reductase OsmC/OhrA